MKVDTIEQFGGGGGEHTVLILVGIINFCETLSKLREVINRAAVYLAICSCSHRDTEASHE